MGRRRREMGGFKIRGMHVGSTPKMCLQSGGNPLQKFRSAWSGRCYPSCCAWTGSAKDPSTTKSGYPKAQLPCKKKKKKWWAGNWITKSVFHEQCNGARGRTLSSRNNFILNTSVQSFRYCGQRNHWAADCPKCGKNVQGGKGEDGKGQGKKGKSGEGKTDNGKGKGKGGKWQARKTLEGYYNHCWKWGHMENVTQKPKARVVKATVLAASMSPKRVSQKKTLQLADLVCARLETNVMTGSGTIVAKWCSSWTVVRRCL